MRKYIRHEIPPGQPNDVPLFDRLCVIVLQEVGKSLFTCTDRAQRFDGPMTSMGNELPSLVRDDGLRSQQKVFVAGKICNEANKAKFDHRPTLQLRSGS
ncbi:hypothetical protein AERO9AM_11043 [Aeromicrobium sp. 9AM]|nr:hypothetical protein AERO9AM_11043 [Aeromicrobium sp. 9AM]